MARGDLGAADASSAGLTAPRNEDRRSRFELGECRAARRTRCRCIDCGRFSRCGCRATGQPAVPPSRCTPIDDAAAASSLSSVANAAARVQGCSRRRHSADTGGRLRECQFRQAIDRPTRAFARVRARMPPLPSPSIGCGARLQSEYSGPRTTTAPAPALRRCEYARTSGQRPDRPRHPMPKHAAIEASRTKGISICAPHGERRGSRPR